MTGPHIVYGKFRGNFKTKQRGFLGRADSPPTDNTHTVQVYQGTLDASEFFTEFKPQDYRKLKSFVLSNVPNVTINPGQHGPFIGNQLFTFTQLILVEPKIIKTYDIDGETYGEVESMAYGKTYASPQLKKLRPDPFNDSGYSDNQPWYQSNNGCVNSGINGCGTLYQGCKTNFWKILGLLLLLLLLLGLIRACNHIANDKQACVNADLAKKERIEKEKEVKETKQQYDLNLKNALANVSTIYFYRNSTDIHINSTGMNGTVDRLAEVIETYDDKSFVLEGHQDDKSIESTGLDIKRAEKIKHILTLKGIDEQRITVVGRQNKDAIPMPLYKFMDDRGTREYNQNMKVTIRVRKQ